MATQGQREYERWARALSVRDHVQDPAELETVQEVYQQIPVEGGCLDVGGHQGRLRRFLAPGQPYVTCDPILDVFD